MAKTKAELTWTDGPPTEPGWYWYKTRRETLACMRLRLEGGKLMIRDIFGDTDEFDDRCWRGRWAGPIPEPREG